MLRARHVPGCRGSSAPLLFGQLQGICTRHGFRIVSPVASWILRFGWKEESVPVAVMSLLYT